MPELNFILPHWMYWGGLIFFPLAAMYLVSKQRKRGTPREPIYFNAYLFWLTAGFAGVHRFYLKSWWGLAFIPLFLGIIYCNSQTREVREGVSRTFAALERQKTEVDRAKPENPATASAKERDRYEKEKTQYAADKKDFDAAAAVYATWKGRSGGFGIALAILLLIDAFLMPGMIRRLHAAGKAGPAIAATAPTVEPPPEVAAIGTAQDPTLHLHTRFTDIIEWVNVKSGEFVAYWGMIAVFVYYYEVIARYIFNSPTNWVHESMFLMFGMQYMISGAYAYREDQHVRVDVVYTHFSTRGKAIADIISSVFFFIFTLTMLWTGWKFAAGSISMGETSFTEWTIQYWPVKLAIPLGALLIVLQGISKLIKDILLVTGKGA